MMKKQILFILFTFSIFSIAAQTTQNGYVKTKGRLDGNGKVVPGGRIGGAAITITGGHSAVSSSNGNFTLTIPEKKYYLQNVQKQGYQIVDPDMLKKQYVYSADPLVITMETRERQEKDLTEAQKKIENTLRQQLQQREQELEALKAAHRITEDEYYEKLQRLYDEKITGEIVKEMAKRYAEIDYDLIDNFQQQFSQYILNGELNRADSLLKTKGDLSSDVDELRQIRHSNVMEQERLEYRRLQLDSSMSYAQWLMEDIAMRCYNKSEIFKLQYRWDSVAYYLNLRVQLDPNNIDWLYEAGTHLYKYYGDYNAAEDCFNRCHALILKSGLDNSWQSANVDNNLGLLYFAKGDYDKAMDSYKKAMRTLKTLFGEGNPYLAQTYLNVGQIYQEKGDYEQAKHYSKKALDFSKMLYGENHPEVASCYNNLGIAYEKSGDLSNSLDCYAEAWNIWTSAYGNDNHPDIAMAFINIGNVHRQQGDLIVADDYYRKALNIVEKVYSKRHPLAALCYNNIGTVYFDKCIKGIESGKWSEMNAKNCLENLLLAVSVFKDVYREMHPKLFECYLNIGKLYNIYYLVNNRNEDYEKALYYFEEAYKVASEYNREDLSVVSLCFALGNFYFSGPSSDHKKSLQYLYRSRDILNKLSNIDVELIKELDDAIQKVESQR